VTAPVPPVPPAPEPPPEPPVAPPAPHRMSTVAKVGLGVLTAVLALSLMVLSQLHTSGRSNILVLTLVNVNLILIVLLALMVARNLVKWLLEGRRQAGSLRTRLVAVFFGFSLVPTVLLYVVASGLLTNSVDSWFAPQVQGPMKGAAEVARSHYQALHDQVEWDASRIAALLPPPDPDGGNGQAAWLRAQLGAWDMAGLALRDAAGHKVTAGEVTVPPKTPVKATRSTRAVPEGERVQAGVPVPAGGYLWAERLIPASEIAALRRITEGYEDFSQLAAIRGPIKKGYRFSFLVIGLVILFSATWFGFYIARGISEPVQRLVDGTREVAGGNLNVRLRRESRDEVGELVEAFNAMTAQLKRNKDALTQANVSLTAGNQELEARRAYMEAILENAATGVIALDAHGRVTLFNRAAAEVLHLDPAQVKGRPYREAFRDVSLSVFSQLIDLMREDDPGRREREVRLEAGGERRTLRVHVRRVVSPGGERLGAVLVFDDLTELIRVQEEAAWREVARRLAHEIKNPLTPIQLSVQRLRKRLGGDRGELPAVVEETTNTILDEVGGLKRLVDEFSEFARMPQPHPVPQSIWGVVGEVAALYRNAYPKVAFEVEEADLGLLTVDREQMRRVFTNLFENAVQAMDGEGTVRVTGGRTPEGTEVRVADTGPGVDKSTQAEVFRPYFSRRKGGTGLGLAIASRIVEEHGGRIRLEDNVPSGAVFVLTFPPAPAA
jgi:two-component system nitrogen regulation sensor histidine kinase NtrY